MRDFTYRRGDVVWFYDRDEQRPGPNVKHGNRPAIVVSDDTHNQFSNTVIIAPMTSKTERRLYVGQFDVVLNGRRSRVLCDQLRVVDKTDLAEPCHAINAEVIEKLNSTLLNILGIVESNEVRLA